ncbi:glycosyltransferase family 2 protein [Halothermothrix orenii]|uniref:Glucosyl-3-phosphoglycerate synthase n=1 Tax=Halothermothrix orenii (strain H 168 / OCM 544 / DSM 9562) TaxID=373903 RepID=B8CW66_HALOH|nr:glycosyltransferase family 2 protein [Halothermothrix orenii]ACL69535.1 glycosyl transferase family 2 [Halothermothrix orenii H 168]
MKVSALIPAYNEENTIKPVITTLKKVEIIDEVVVIDDGSTDNTSDVARGAGARVVRLEENGGKGAALQKGIEIIESDFILMLDGDLIGLTREHIYRLLNPVIAEEVDMTVGVFSEGRGLTDLAQFISPHLSGQRAIKTRLIKKIDNLNSAGYGVEIAINKFVKKYGTLKYVDLTDLTHLMKEEKRGFARGFIDRMKMYYDILKVFIKKI